MQPAVITSKPARQDFQKIQSEHSILLEGMANQSVKVNAYQQQKAAEVQAQNTLKAQVEQENAAVSSQAKKDANDFAIKQGELDIKRASLAQTD